MLSATARRHAPRRTLLSRVACAALLALSVASPGPASAAHITDVADAMDEKHPVEVDLDFGYQHLKKQTRITREQTDPSTQKRGILLIDELDHTETTDQMNFRLNIGLYHDLELHIIAPFLIGQKQEWGLAAAAATGGSTLQTNPGNLDISGCNASGGCSASKGPILPTAGQSLRAGFGDPTIGIAWGPINEEREQQLRPDLFPPDHPVSTWVIGLDYTLPLPGDVDDPSKFIVPAVLTTTPLTPVSMAANAGSASHPAIRKAHVFSPWTAFSKRFKVLDPYVGVRATLPIALGGSAVGDGAYDNCWHTETLADVATQNCAAAAWKGSTGYQPAYTGAFTVGTELIVVDDKVAQQKVAFDLHTEITWFSPSRGYTQVSDMLGKLTYEEEHVQALTTLGFYGRIARWLHVRVSGTLGVDTPHFLTAESIGKDLNGDGQVQISAGAATKSGEQNPTYDFRVDQPGRRLRAEAMFVWGVSGALALNF